MKKILLSAAMFAAVITGVNAQCDVADRPTGTEVYNSISTAWLYEGTVLKLQHAVESGTDSDDGGYLDMTEDEVVGVLALEGDVEYYAKIYTTSPRVNTYRAVLIDLGNTGTFTVLQSTAGAGNWSWQADGKMFFTISKGDLPTNGLATLRYVVAKDDGAASNYIATCAGVDIGEFQDYAVEFPSAFPPTAIDDNVATKEGVEIVIDVVSNDVEGTTEITSGVLVDSPINGNAVVNDDNTVTYTPNADFRGVDAFTYTVTNSIGTSETAAVRIVVYGYKDIDNQNVLIIEDFDTMDETVGGILTDDAGFAWDGSFGWAYDAPGGSKADESSEVKDGAGAMSVTLNSNGENPISIDDTHTGTKVKHDNIGSKLKFNASDANNVLGMHILLHEVTPGAKFGFVLKKVDDGSLVYSWIDGADLSTEWEYGFIGLDLSTLEGDYTGDYVLHKIRYGADAMTSPMYFYVDEIGLYPTSNLSSAKVELEGVSVYPNPVTNVLNVKAGKDAKVTVLSTVGSVVYKGNAEAINTQSWNKGLYFVVVEEGNKSKTVKVIK